MGHLVLGQLVGELGDDFVVVGGDDGFLREVGTRVVFEAREAAVGVGGDVAVVVAVVVVLLEDDAGACGRDETAERYKLGDLDDAATRLEARLASGSKQGA